MLLCLACFHLVRLEVFANSRAREPAYGLRPITVACALDTRWFAFSLCTIPAFQSRHAAEDLGSNSGQLRVCREMPRFSLPASQSAMSFWVTCYCRELSARRLLGKRTLKALHQPVSRQGCCGQNKIAAYHSDCRPRFGIQE